MLIRHANNIAVTLIEAPQYYEPLFFNRDVKGQIVSIVDEWCCGYVKGMALDPLGWQPLRVAIAHHTGAKGSKPDRLLHWHIGLAIAFVDLNGKLRFDKLVIEIKRVAKSLIRSAALEANEPVAGRHRMGRSQLRRLGSSRKFRFRECSTD